MESLNATELKRAIRQAFADAEYPGDDNITYDKTGSNLEAQQVARYFRGKRWNNIDGPFITGYDEFADASACLSFMTPGAFRYYLPAFLLVVIDNFDAAGLIASTTVSKLAPWPDPSDKIMASFVQERLSGFTASQRVAIRAFLEYVRELHADELSQEDWERALAHWS